MAIATLQVPTTGLFKPDIRLSRTCAVYFRSARMNAQKQPGKKAGVQNQVRGKGRGEEQALVVRH